MHDSNSIVKMKASDTFLLYHAVGKGTLQPTVDLESEQILSNQIPRVTIQCPEKNEFGAKVVALPKSLQLLLDIGLKKFGFYPTKVLTKDGALIEDVEVIRDGDHLILTSDNFEGKLLVPKSPYSLPCPSSAKLFYEQER